MVDDTDFVALYEELGLDTECSMVDFKGAYRRRVAKLHPDHFGDPSTIPRLQRLNRQYAAAIEFQRIHGRLPGATHRVASRPGQEGVARQASTQGHAPSITRPVAGNHGNRRYVLLLLLIAAVAFWLDQRPAHAPARDMPVTLRELKANAASPRPAGYLRIGMDKDAVRSLQGQPFNNHEVRWDYGPSWVEFRCGKVVDWYSSPLHPLRVHHADADKDISMADGKMEHC